MEKPEFQDQKTLDLAAYLIKGCDQAIPKARLIKLIYLADWKYALEYGKRFTNIVWQYNHYGPYVAEVIDLIRRNSDFEIKTYFNSMGNPAEEVSLNNHQRVDSLNNEERAVADLIIKQTKDLCFNDFIKLVYSTYPVRKTQKYETLDLVQLAHEYKTFEG